MRALFGPLTPEASVRFICFSLIVLAVFAIPHSAFAEIEDCAFIVDPDGRLAGGNFENISVPTEVFDRLVSGLRKTIPGANLATVNRAEERLKLPILVSNQMGMTVFKTFLSEGSYSELMSGLDVNQPGYIRSVVARMDQLSRAGKWSNSEPLFNRNEPIPAGVTDRTFTYYTPSIRDATFEWAKIQPRIRTYLRQIDFRELAEDFPVKVFDAETGTFRTFVKTHAGTIRQFTGPNGEHPVLNRSRPDGDFSVEEMKMIFGDGIFFAPHGQFYKLEMKVTLKDMITSPKFPHLAGHYMILKVDTPISFEQMRGLFDGFIESDDAVKRKKEAMGRVVALKSDLIEADQRKTDRVSAIFAVLEEGVSRSPYFERIIRAVSYVRSAIDSKAGWQLTWDRESRAYNGPNMYLVGSKGIFQVRTPQDIAEHVSYFVADENADRHTEFKIPSPYMARLGMDPYNPETVPNIPISEEFLNSYKSMATIFDSQKPPLGAGAWGKGKGWLVKHGR